MNPITFPIDPGSDGPDVTDLQQALLHMLRRAALLTDQPDFRQELTNAIRSEMANQIYDDGTRKTVSIFQEEQGIDAHDSGAVDEQTAKAINALLREWGLLETSPSPRDEGFVVTGTVRNDQGVAIREGTVLAWHISDRGPIRLGSDALDAERTYVIRYQTLPGVESISLRVSLVDASGTVVTASDVTENAGRLERIDLVLPVVVPDIICTVTGTVSSSNRTGSSGLRVRIVEKRVGGDAGITEADTGRNGHYTATYRLDPARIANREFPDLQAQVFQGDALLGSSGIVYDAGSTITLDVLLPNLPDAGASEHETLLDTLSTAFSGNLRDVQETPNQRDITYLANKSGWDARAVAMAALADRFGQHRTTDDRAIAPPLYYALFRAGIPANETALYRMDASVAERVWKQSITTGLIPAALADEVPAAVEMFRDLGATTALDSRVVAGTSTMQEMLAPVLTDTAQQRQFSEMRVRHGKDRDAFWTEVETTFGADTAKRLQLDGQLGFLTLNNAPMIAKLHETEAAAPVDSLLDLARRGYYRAEKWQELGIDTVPDAIPGESAPERLSRYHELLATQIRVEFPTAVTAEMVRNKEIPLTLADDDRTAISDFLSGHQGAFEIGMQPVEQFVKRNNLHDQVTTTTLQEVTRLQRVRQITPTDQAMNALLENGLDSATRVLQFDEADFIANYGGQIGGETAAKVTYRKARQVYSAVLNLATSFVANEHGPTLGNNSQALMISGQSSIATAPNAADVIAMPTLEQLLGSADYCDCEHCRSILSPAAYLVDLLMFADRPQNDLENPLTVLLERRPDIEYLPLTCENTNTPMPYIDIVNETLEYFVAHQLSLDNFKGYDNDQSASGPELLANPRFVNAAAYTTLSGALFPPPLPYHDALNALRLTFQTFETSLAETMLALSNSNDLERAAADTYGWRDIRMEDIGCSRAEYRILTDRTIALTDLYGLPPGTSEDQTRQLLTNAKAFARRTGITYRDLADILKTQFVNPGGRVLPRYERLHVPATALKQLKDGVLTAQEFEALLPPGLDPAAYGGSIPAWVKNDANYNRLMHLIVLSDPADGANPNSFDTVELRYLEPIDPPRNLTSVDFVRIARFIRLWRKLGWTIEQTDAAIAALYPPEHLPDGASDAADLLALDTGFLAMLPRFGVLRQAMRQLDLKPKNDLLRALTLWVPIGTYGANSLYREMFLTPGHLSGDAAFADNGFGEFLTANGPKVVDHGETLRAAFALTADELTAISDRLDPGHTADLTMDTISSIFRYGWLARELKISVRELLLLIDLSGIDPFASPDPVQPAIVRFIDLVQKLKASPLKVAEALYLLWNVDLSGRSAPTTDDIAAFARTLRAAFAAVDTAFAVQDDPTGDLTRARIGMVYGTEAADVVFGLLGSSVADIATYDHPAAELDTALIAAGDGRVTYNDFRKQLAFAGLMTPAIRDAIQTAADTSTDFSDAAERDAFKAAVTAIFTANQTRIDAFFTRYPELRAPVMTFVASTAPPQDRFRALLTTLTASLVQRRRAQAALETVTASTGIDASLTAAILQDATVLHAVSGPADTPALDDLVAIAGTGLSAAWFWRATATGVRDLDTPAIGVPDYSDSGNQHLPANGATAGDPISVILRGYLDAPESDDYTIRIDTEAGATVKLTIGGTDVPLDPDGATWTNHTRVSLTAGTLTPVVLSVENIHSRLALKWATAVRGLEPIPARYAYSATLAENLEIAWIRFVRAASLATGLNLTAGEFAFVATHPDLTIDGAGWLNALTTKDTPSKANSAKLGDVLLAALEFAALKSAISPDDERLLGLLRDPDAVLPNGANQLETVTGWNGASLDALLDRFGLTRASVSGIPVFARLHRLFALLATSGIPASALIAATINEPTATTVTNLQAALRARYAANDWRDVVKPINDTLRGQRRDALTAFILQKLSENPATAHIDTPDRLFEYFLMDVQMEPCMETSRIRHALSSVQLFIERCLMNLEPRVAPSSIRGKQWEWMKRYRVWEANRKVFLWPENWLEEELRDNVSYQFKESISSLLQSDITEDAAAAALGNYLVKLEEIAKLEPVAIHLVERDPGVADDVAHVIGRTAGGKRKYFYRQRGGGSWTPWEPIKLDIEGDPVAPVIWKNRLFLFWLRILQDTPTNPETLPTTAKHNDNLADITMNQVMDNSSSLATTTSKVRIRAALCWSEFANGKWQDAKTSDLNRPAYLWAESTVGENGFDRSWLKIEPVEIDDVLYLKFGGSWFALYNTHSLPVRKEDDPSGFTPYATPQFSRGISSGSWITMEYWGTDPVQGNLSEYREVLKGNLPLRVVEPQDAVDNQWLAPFIVEDRRHVFWVRTATTPVRIAEWHPYGAGGGEIFPGIKIPDVVKPEKKPFPPPLYYDGPDEFEIPDVIGPIIDPVYKGDVLKQVTQFVTEDARIKVGLDMTGTVQFGDQMIGPSGPANIGNRQR